MNFGHTRLQFFNCVTSPFVPLLRSLQHLHTQNSLAVLQACSSTNTGLHGSFPFNRNDSHYGLAVKHGESCSSAVLPDAWVSNAGA